jgi:uncharacterized ion transporter superfamily protein YfcC
VAPEAIEGPAGAGFAGRDAAIIALVIGTFALYVYGVGRFGWEFEHLAALFFAMGVAAGVIGGLRVAGTADGFVDGFRAMALAALLIGFARAIFVVLDEGAVIDTIVHGLFTPIGQLPVAASAVGMMIVHAGIHVPVPSTSSQAILTMPVLVPLSDLLGLSRQVTVLAYQYGAGLAELITPTNGALMAMLAAAGVPFDRWFGFAARLCLALFALGAVAIVTAIALGI